MKTMKHSLKTCLLFAGIGMLGAATPALAQSGEELVVTGSYGKVPDSVQSLSITVSYADLDLGTAAGKEEFRRRLTLTSRFLCEKLGESNTPPAVGPSCKDAAVKDALQRAGTIEEGFAPRGTTWVAGPAWQAPYPQEWATPYP